MARIAYPARGAFPADLARTLDAMPRHAPIEMLAHSPLLAQRFLQLGQVQLGALELSPRNRELLILHVAAKVGCEYEYRQHIPISEAAGVEPDLREAIWSGELDTAALPDDERALLAFIDAVLRSPQVDEAEVTAVRRQFSDSTGASAGSARCSTSRSTSPTA
jgi:alkylhydroperoxidase family enzyme